MFTPDEAATVQPSGVLLRKDIRDLKIIAEDASESCYKPASYDLRIGNLYVSTDGRQEYAREPLQNCVVEVPAFGSLIVSTREFLRMPGNVVGDFDLRIKLAVKGLFVQMGTQVEPHYNGRLFAILHNVTASPVKLKWGGDDAERIFTIQFFFTNGLADEPKNPKEFRTLTQFLENTDFAQNQLGGLLRLIEENKAEFEKAKATIQYAKQELTDALDNEIQTKFGLLQAKMDAKDAVDKAISELQSDEKKFKRQLIQGGFFIAAFSVIIPVFIGFAINFARPKAFADIDEGIISTVLSIQSDIQALQNASNGNNRLDSVVSRVDEISTRLVELQRQIAQSAEIVQNDNQSPGASPEAEQ